MEVIEIQKMEVKVMDTSSLKNIVVLKDLPSNLVEEAIVVLKENQKVPKLELIDKKIKNHKDVPTCDSKKNTKENSKDYIVKEAQMLIAEYISKIEGKNKKENKSVQTWKNKYKKLKVLNYFLLAGLMISILIQTNIFHF